MSMSKAEKEEFEAIKSEIKVLREIQKNAQKKLLGDEKVDLCFSLGTEPFSGLEGDELMEAIVTHIKSVEIYCSGLELLRTPELKAADTPINEGATELLAELAILILDEGQGAEFDKIEDYDKAKEFIMLAALAGAEIEKLDMSVEEIQEIACPASYLKGGAGKALQALLVARIVKGKNETDLIIVKLRRPSDIIVTEATYHGCALMLRDMVESKKGVITAVERGHVTLGHHQREFAIEETKKDTE